jgi:hypothetical protein
LRVIGPYRVPVPMTWIQAVPIGLACVVWLFGPGLVTTYALGLRGVALASVAPVVSIAIVACTAVVAALAGVGWSLQLAVAV